MPGVLVGERLQPFPHILFEVFLAQDHRLPENHREALKQDSVGAISAGEIEQRRIDAQVVPGRRNIVGDDEGDLATRECRFRADAGKIAGVDKGAEHIREYVFIVGFGRKHR